MSTFREYSILSTTTRNIFPPEPDVQSAVWLELADPRALAKLLKLESPVAAASILDVYIKKNVYSRI